VDKDRLGDSRRRGLRAVFVLSLAFPGTFTSGEMHPQAGAIGFDSTRSGAYGREGIILLRESASAWRTSFFAP